MVLALGGTTSISARSSSVPFFAVWTLLAHATEPRVGNSRPDNTSKLICGKILNVPEFHLKNERVGDTEHIRPGLTKTRHECPEWHAERILRNAEFIAVPNFFISFSRPASPYCEEYVYIYTYLTA